jgi:hypothetical protein
MGEISEMDGDLFGFREAVLRISHVRRCKEERDKIHSI